MFNLVRRGVVDEASDGANVSYVLNDSDLFFLTSYKILQSQEGRNFAKCVKLKYNGKIKLLYLTSNYRSLQSLLSSLDTDRFVAILSNLLGTVLDIKENGFLQCPNIDVSIEKIFVDQSTLSVRLIYLPINMGYSDADTAAFERALRTGLANLIKTVPTLSSPKMIKIQMSLVNPAIDLEQLCGIISAADTLERRSGDLAADSGNLHAKQPRLTFTAIGAPRTTVFNIDKPEYLIGKNQDAVDGAILYSTAVSRVHCKMILKDGRYFAVDLGSANGTFVNNQKIAANTPTLLNTGDVVKLANCEFAVLIR